MSEPRHSTTSGGPSVQVMLAEFVALRNEIQSRLLLELTVTSIFVTGASVIVGIALTHNASAVTYFTVPALYLVCQLLTMEQHRMIILLGEYIRLHLWPALSERVGGTVPSWEQFWKAHREPGTSHGGTSLSEGLYPRGRPGWYASTARLVIYGGASLAAAILGNPLSGAFSGGGVGNSILGYALMIFSVLVTSISARYWAGENHVLERLRTSASSTVART
jgi:hypothetical protein